MCVTFDVDLVVTSQIKAHCTIGFLDVLFYEVLVLKEHVLVLCHLILFGAI